MFEEKDLPKVKDVLKQLLKYSTNIGVKYSPRSQILIYELTSLSKPNLKYVSILRTLAQMKSNNLKSIRNFEQEYKKAGIHLAQFKRKEWTLIMPYQNQVIRKKFKIAGVQFEIINKKKFFTLINEEDFFTATRTKAEYLKAKLQLPDLFLITQAKGVNIHSCWDYARAAFTIYQGIYDYGSLQDKWIEQDYALTSFRHPEWVVATNGSNNIEFATYLLSTTRYAPHLKDIRSHARIQALVKYCTAVADENTTKGLIYDSYRLYAQAMESVHRYNKFLSLWQLIENICMSSLFGGSTSEVINRINLITKERNLFDFPIHGTYKHLAKKRNDIVHKGLDCATNIDINILKTIAEESIKWLVEKEIFLKTRAHINEYFSLRNKNDKDMAAILETIQYLKPAKRAT